MILLYQVGSRAIFAYGFAKSRKDDLDPNELEAYRELAKVYLGMSEDAIDAHEASGSLKEITDHDEEEGAP